MESEYSKCQFGVGVCQEASEKQMSEVPTAGGTPLFEPGMTANQTEISPFLVVEACTVASDYYMTVFG